MSCRAIFLDFDDTLHDYRGAYNRAFERATAPICAAAGVAATDLRQRCQAPWAAIWEDFVAGRMDEEGLWAARTAAVLAQAGLPPDAEAASGFTGRHLAAMASELRLFADAAEALDLVHSRRPRPLLAILTNGPQSVQRRRIDQLGLSSRVDFVVVSGELGVAKPDLAFFTAALRQADCAAADAVMIGDNPVADIAGAKAAGLRAVWVDRAGGEWTATGARPDAAFPDLVGAVRWALD